MAILSVRSLAIALLVGAASAKKFFMDFEDLHLPNDASCSVKKFADREAYHGIWPMEAVRIVNTTVTKNCKAQLKPSAGKAISGTNAALANFEFGYDAINGSPLTGDTIFDFGVEFNAEELAAKDATVTIHGLITDFGDGGGTGDIVFSTAKDGFGPYHAVFPSTSRFFEASFRVDVNITPVPSQSRWARFYLDNLQIETIDQ